MHHPGSFLDKLGENGGSPFFFTSAIQSMIFGEVGRENQKKLIDDNSEFREHLRDLQKQYRKEQLEEQLLFRRESYELGRQYLIQQTVAQNESRKKQIEFRNFINNYWPLERTPFSVLEEKKEYLLRKSIIPMTILVAKTEVTSSTMESSKYGNFCEDLISRLYQLPNITIEKTPWSKPCRSRISEAMNINYIMRGIPTLIIFPYQNENSIGIETVSWSFGRGLQSMHHDKLINIKNIDNGKVLKTALSAVVATIGMVRDAYMIAEYHTPAIFPGIVDAEILSIAQLREHIISHYDDLKIIVNSTEFKELCTGNELDKISNSLCIKQLN